jgi:hypothetical protein
MSRPPWAFRFKVKATALSIKTENQKLVSKDKKTKSGKKHSHQF